MTGSGDGRTIRKQADGKTKCEDGGGWRSGEWQGAEASKIPVVVVVAQDGSWAI